MFPKMNLTEALKKYGYAGVVTMILIGSLVFQGDIYECPGNDPPIRECIKLSESGRSCYHTTGRDLCSDGEWVSLNVVKDYPTGKLERCTPQGCAPI